MPKPADWKVPITCLVWQHEKAPETGKIHIQGFVVFVKQQRIDVLQDILKVKCHCETVKFPQSQFEYCQKLETRLEGTEPFVYGEVTSYSGKRNDVEDFKTAIQSGATDRELAENHFKRMLASYRAVPFFRKTFETAPPRLGAPVIHLVVGPAGSGKTVWAEIQATEAMEADFMELVGYDSADKPKWPKPYHKATGKWWDLYQGYEDIILNDFGGSFMKASDFTRYFDTVSIPIEQKGLMLEINSRRVWITSNYPPQCWWENTDGVTKEAIYRRIDVIYFMSGDNELGRVDKIWRSDRRGQFEGCAFEKFRATPEHDSLILNVQRMPNPHIEARPNNY